MFILKKLNRGLKRFTMFSNFSHNNVFSRNYYEKNYLLLLNKLFIFENTLHDYKYSFIKILIDFGKNLLVYRNILNLPIFFLGSFSFSFNVDEDLHIFSKNSIFIFWILF